jgi:prophage antirepressor-like protein
MTDLIKLNREFEGNPLTTIFYQNKPCWIAREVGNAMGYARNGERLVTKITKEWSEEFIEEHDFVSISGSELAEFKVLSQLHTDSVSSRAKHLILLFEPGLHLALAKSNKPVGRRLRRFIADEVLPQISRDGAYLPERTVEDGKLVESESAISARRLALAEAREARLDRQLKSSALKSLVKTLKHAGHVSEDIIVSYEIAAAEEATGQRFAALKPKTEDNWKSPSDIAARLGISSQRVGRTISELNLRGNHPGLSKAIVNKAKGHDRTVTSYLYSPEAVRRIENSLSENGWIGR